MVAGLLAVARLHVAVEVSLPHEHLAADVTLVRRLTFRVQSHVLVEVARVAEGPAAHLRGERKSHKKVSKVKL